MATVLEQTINAADGVTSNDDAIFGFGGNDTISALVGNDVIFGGLGADTINGGSSVDTAAYSDSTSGVVVGWRLALGLAEQPKAIISSASRMCRDHPLTIH
jgi:hypothetical protein